MSARNPSLRLCPSIVSPFVFALASALSSAEAVGQQDVEILPLDGPPNISSNKTYRLGTFRGQVGSSSISLLHLDEDGKLMLPPGRLRGQSLFDRRELSARERRFFHYIVETDEDASTSAYYVDIDEAPLVPLLMALVQHRNIMNGITMPSQGTQLLVEDPRASDIEINVNVNSANFTELLDVIESESGCDLSMTDDLIVTRC